MEKTHDQHTALAQKDQKSPRLPTSLACSSLFSDSCCFARIDPKDSNPKRAMISRNRGRMGSEWQAKDEKRQGTKKRRTKKKATQSDRQGGG